MDDGEIDRILSRCEHQLGSGRIHKAEFNSQRTENLSRETHCAAIHHIAHYDVIACLKQREAQGRNSGHACGKAHCRRRIFERPERAF